MSEIRQSVATKEWVIIATERARRPHEFANQNELLTQSRPPWESDCPFCPGHEEPPPVERLRIPAEGPWALRVVHNRYPALAPDGPYGQVQVGLRRALTGVGRHEVIVEAPQHNTCLALMTPGEVARTLEAFQQRGNDYLEDDRLEHIVYFENHGREAGASIEHPHAQMVALPVVPYDVRMRVEEAQRYHDATGHCVYCDMREDELADGRRVITANDYFVGFIPFAAYSPFHTWIMPRQHNPNFLHAGDEELAALGAILRDVLGRLYRGLNDPPYNVIIRSSPLHDCDHYCLHWYVSIVARVTENAGFEMCSGMFINTSLPEESAAFLRSIAP